MGFQDEIELVKEQPVVNETEGYVKSENEFGESVHPLTLKDGYDYDVIGKVNIINAVSNIPIYSSEFGETKERNKSKIE